MLTAKQVATLLGVSRRTVYRWCEDGHMKSTRYGKEREPGSKARGGAIRIPESEVAARRALLDSQ